MDVYSLGRYVVSTVLIVIHPLYHSMYYVTLRDTIPLHDTVHAA